MFAFCLKLTALLIILVYFLFKYTCRNYTYWKKRGVPYVQPAPFFGNLFQVFFFQKQLGISFAEYYEKFDSPYFGLYVFSTPILLIKSPAMIKKILVKDFQHFNDRSIASNEQCDVLSSNMLFMAKNPEWKYLRTKMTPVFANMKNMVPLIKEVGDNMLYYLNQHLDEKFIDCQDVSVRYTTDVIASCAFGVDARSFYDENSPFRLASKRMWSLNLKTGVSQLSYFMAHSLVKLLNLPFFDVEMLDLLRRTFWVTLEDRKRTEAVRHDVIDAMIELENRASSKEDFKFEGDKVLAQAVQFFTAGYQSASLTIAFTLYELSLKSEIQNRLRLEMKNTLECNKEIKYSTIQNMKYLNMVVKETLRKYPPLPFLQRKCVSDYKVPNEDFIIEEGTTVYISSLGLHHDKKHFPNPELFDPERFADKTTENTFSYIPFGKGPRDCIGDRFSLLVVKYALLRVLTEFSVEATSITPIPICYSLYSFFLSPVAGMPLKFSKINLFT
ncbi:hypothetical protein RI129_004972 [Pyrocoelia pectoralis]|uniref:Cytochrome P450 n=1 Tax=Pyrocoelia pectoralis TaxID=417401 RepID=A0AAN7ZRB3_9COLE